MNVITNSRLKESIRQKNYSVACANEQQMRAQLATEVANINRKLNNGGGLFVALLIGLGILFVSAVGIAGIIVAAVITVIVRVIRDSALKNQIQEATNRTEEQIRNAYHNSDVQTQQEISAYDRDVKMHAQKVMAKAESIAPMVDHVVNMFQRMISHADSGAHMKFIEADFTYEVVTSGIKYSYQSRYTNPQDDYNFNRERYRDLSTPAECEGLAQTLAKLTINKMKSIYPPNSINISLSHNDAQVTLHFKGANKNFVPARDIM